MKIGISTSHYPMKQNKRVGKAVLMRLIIQKKMYAIPSAEDKCPVKSLLLFMSKTDPTSLFNRCSKPALCTPDNESVWYYDIALKPFQFTRFMADI